MNNEAIKKEIDRVSKELKASTDKMDIYFLNSRLNSLKSELAGVARKQDEDYGCND